MAFHIHQIALNVENLKERNDSYVCTLQQQILSHWELTRTRVDDLKDRQYHVRNLEELFK